MPLIRLQTYYDGLIKQLSRLQTNFLLVQTAHPQMPLMDLPPRSSLAFNFLFNLTIGTFDLIYCCLCLHACASIFFHQMLFICISEECSMEGPGL